MKKCGKTAYILSIALIIISSISVRIYWAYRQDGLHNDEYASIWFSNNKIDGWYFVNSRLYSKELQYNKAYTGKEIKTKYFYDDKSIKDCIDDIKSLYKNSKDPFISNFYYSLLRLSFIGRSVYDVQNIILTGTILNCLFFIVSFIFIYKISNLVFNKNKLAIVFTLFISSLLTSSITFSMFLRPYQLQETLFVIFVYLVFNALIKKYFYVLNFILLSVFAGLAYLSNYSSIVFVLCISLAIFIYYNFEKIGYTEIELKYNNFLKIALIIFVIFVISSSLLGLIKREGGILVINTYQTQNNSVTTEVSDLKIKYKSLIFKRSDIYHLFDIELTDSKAPNEKIKCKYNYVGEITAFSQNKIEPQNIKVAYRLKPNIKKIINALFFIPLFYVILNILSLMKKLKPNNMISILAKNYKILLFFAFAFAIGFLVSQALYSNFIQSLLSSNSRATQSLKFKIGMVGYINHYGNIGVIFSALIIYISFCRQKIAYKKEYLPVILIMFSALLYALISDMLAPYREMRYSTTSYILMMPAITLSIFFIIDNIKAKYIFAVLIICLYIGNIFVPSSFDYIELNKSENLIFKQNPNYSVYGINKFLQQFNVSDMENSQKYILVKNAEDLEKQLLKDKPDNFYLTADAKDYALIDSKEIENYILIQSSKINSYNEHYSIYEFSKK